MEAGFLLEKEVSKKGSLADKVKNIKGKLLGKDGKPLKSILKSGKVNPNQVIPDVGSCMNNIDRVGTTVDKSSITQGSNDNRMPIHAAIVKETIPVADVNASTLNSGPNDLLGVDIDGTNKCGVHVLVLTNDVKVVGADVAIQITVVDEISDKFANTLYGYFIGDRLAFPIVEAYIKNAWAKYGLERAIFRNGFFFFKFFSHEGMVKTIEGGHWFIRCMPIFLNIWTANTKLKREEITRVPVWVKIHNVPMVADMCLNPWGHNSFARVLVELSSKCAVMESIVVFIPLPKGKEHYLETLNVEYDWWPPRCSKCKIFDHVDEFYPSWGKKVALDLLAGEGRVHDTIIKQKKKGMNVADKTKDMDTTIKPLWSCLKNTKIDGKILGKDGKPMKPVRGAPVVVDVNEAKNKDIVGVVKDTAAKDSVVVQEPEVVTSADVGMKSTQDNSDVVHGCSLDKNEEPTDSGNTKSSFASILQNTTMKKTVKITELHNPKRVEVTLPIDAVEESALCYKTDFSSFNLLLRKGMEKVIENRLWLIRLVPLILNVWTPNSKMKKDEITLVPLWIKLYNVPIVAYSKVGLSLITTQVGRPIMLDSYTRTFFGKIEIEYEWEPPRCSMCKIFDHVDDHCPKKHKEDIPTQDMDDGFMAINRKRVKPKQQSTKRLIDGIKLSKPTPKYYYRHVLVQEVGETSSKQSKEEVKNTNQKQVNKIALSSNDVPLKNSFISLMEEGETDVGNEDSLKTSKDASINEDIWQSSKTILSTVNYSDSEEIKELNLEDSIVNRKKQMNANKGASTPYEEVPNV
ncbi:zinc knuckle CX2CX4HX4C containing protein [Tanacetum coccineum]|uniref:Zinc knuckle CX2CX4HX4C containing protein n=1 Tax=Tanacetum coccineum TaxID=301880 RepID=A0ABQ5HW81_9ASTR